MDNEYNDIVKDILDNKEFNKLKEYKHHGITRYDHVLRVSKWAYKVSKKWKLDYVSATRAGLLHDFFFVNNQEVKLSYRIKVLFIHPKMALENSKKYFKLNKKEERIILSHMFPVGLCIPLSLEGWIVNIADDIASIYERFKSIFK
jgi:uncharacterized protein